MPVEWRRRLAELTSNILNPFLVSLVMIVLLSFESTPGKLDALRWSLILIAISILPVFLVVAYLIYSRRIEGLSITARKERNKIYLLASACAVAGSVLLPYLGAPTVLVATFVAGLSAILTFMCINLLWKISVHTAFVAASITILIFLYGLPGMISAVALPPIAWARIELEHHSPAQVAIGALLATVIVVVVFSLFGLIGRISI